MSYLLDTATCVDYLNRRSAPMIARFAALSPDEFFVYSVVKAELLFGALRSRDPSRTLATVRLFLEPFVSLPFDDAAAEHYAQIRAQLTSQGTRIGPNDLLSLRSLAPTGWSSLP